MIVTKIVHWRIRVRPLRLDAHAVDDVDDVVRTLKRKGVKFEHYDLPDTRREGDVHVSGDMKVAWFKDPDGNILSVASRLRNETRAGSRRSQ